MGAGKQVEETDEDITDREHVVSYRRRAIENQEQKERKL
jgi:hypothetical protein